MSEEEEQDITLHRSLLQPQEYKNENAICNLHWQRQLWQRFASTMHGQRENVGQILTRGKSR